MYVCTVSLLLILATRQDVDVEFKKRYSECLSFRLHFGVSTALHSRISIHDKHVLSRYFYDSEWGKFSTNRRARATRCRFLLCRCRLLGAPSPTYITYVTRGATSQDEQGSPSDKRML